ncbi:lipolytic protein G-D-S-L family [Methylobacterium sp. 4-46]|uniref:DUF459 domain-containing protein n=1 Tax=unclassified Methylobacterium TaxID=2615210 RepID=UPI000165CB51|nr:MULTISPECIES: GDSL-type esterase/lipase family protein [Methylobacterium]ACA18966.1 lipolytic protein G-D-S-L family [Methylobacterium sp. 4-46]WFT78184.1 GDSL-type esterase/lipase family protein [Methylobacterium nodulans]
MVQATRLSRRALLGGLAGLAAAPRARAAAGDEIRIAFVGDSLADGIWGGAFRLASREPCLGGRIRLGRFAENGTGLTRPAKFDWVAQSRTVAETFRPTLAVVSLGLNDRQSIVEAGRARLDLGTPAWRSRYAELAQAVARNLAPAGGGSVLWLGLPVLRDRASQDDAAEKNAIFAQALRDLAAPRTRFVAPWRQDPSGPDSFQPYGPDLHGAKVQIRAPDGIHFTAAGYDVLAAHLLRAAADLLAEQGVALTFPCRR